ncbi:hypothetical protein DFS34DRAFT_689392 [Phlyctochytrium arcticum]|nr:hypothetical protein DFS34DRAFT_689392 [Phlyctochytrium arcticum]
MAPITDIGDLEIVQLNHTSCSLERAETAFSDILSIFSSSSLHPLRSLPASHTETQRKRPSRTVALVDIWDGTLRLAPMTTWGGRLIDDDDTFLPGEFRPNVFFPVVDDHKRISCLDDTGFARYEMESDAATTWLRRRGQTEDDSLDKQPIQAVEFESGSESESDGGDSWDFVKALIDAAVRKTRPSHDGARIERWRMAVGNTHLEQKLRFWGQRLLQRKRVTNK